MIKFQGLIGRTFGGFVTIRGLAKFSDIVNCSEAKDYQREIIPQHFYGCQRYHFEVGYIYYKRRADTQDFHRCKIRRYQ
jgi:hypothetical protein